MGFVQEFKDFAMKGNLVDMAIAVVMGGAFGKVTSAFIDGMFMPVIGLIFNVGDLSQAKWVLKEAVKGGAEGGKDIAEVAVKYGDFIGMVLNFVIVALVMFLVIKGINNMKKATPPPPPAGPTADQVLLTEIRDLLKK
ncbi:MAG: large-conductance mechanosensitive channel protein MscL [Bacteroidia bacterium]